MTVNAQNSPQLNSGLTAILAAATTDITVSGLSGDSDGGYRFKGMIVTPAAAPEYYLYFNGADAVAGGSSGAFSTGAAVAAVALSAHLYIASVGSSEAGNVTFWGHVGSKQGIVQGFTCLAFQERGSGTINLSYHTAGRFTMNAQITSIGVHGTTATALGIGSYLCVQKLGMPDAS